MPRGKAARTSYAPLNGPDGDQAFEPNASYDFEDPETNLESFDGSGMDFDMADEMFSMNPADFMLGMPQSNNAPYPAFPGDGYQSNSMNNIVNQRHGNVRQQFGQITPPDETTPETAPKTDEDVAKANRTQRARNAANKRHSKTKKRKDSGQDEEDQEGEAEESSKTTSVQREKNRIAAAKCRAKKKATSEEMQDVHRDGARQNSFLHREVRELRDQKAFLRNTLLQHDPSVCQCHAIHRFNLAQAQQLAMGVGAMIPQAMSPSQRSTSSIQTPGSEESMGRKGSFMGQVSIDGRPHPQSRHQSFASPMTQGFPHGGFGDQMPTREQMQMAQMQMHAQHGAGHDMSQLSQFHDFMQDGGEGHGA